MKNEAAITAIAAAILEYSKSIDPPFHIFNDQGRVLYKKREGDGVDENSPCVGFIVYHKIGTPWPDGSGSLELPKPPEIQLDNKYGAIIGFEIPADAPADFDWQSVVKAARERLEKELVAHE